MLIEKILKQNITKTTLKLKFSFLSDKWFFDTVNFALEVNNIKHSKKTYILKDLLTLKNIKLLSRVFKLMQWQH